MRTHVLSVPLLLITAFACRPADKPVAAASAAPPTPNTVTILAEEYGFKLTATSIPAGFTTIKLVNTGKELHHAQLYRLEGGKTAADFSTAIQAGGPLPAWAIAAGGPNAALPGGGETSATMRLEPGPHVIVCWIPGTDGMPHVAKGMTAALDVVSEGAVAGEPTGDVEMTLTDYAFGLSAPLTAGPHVIRAVNQAGQPHEVLLIRLAPGATARMFVDWAEKGMKGPPPAQPVGGITSIATGGVNSFPVNLTPGTYGLICFVPDAKDGEPHFAHGMVMEFTIT